MGREKERKKAIRSTTFITQTIHNTGLLIGREKKSNFVGFSATNSRENSGQILLESDRFCADFTNVFNETKLLFVGGGGNDESEHVQQEETSTTYQKHRQLIAWFAISFGLGIVLHKVFCLSFVLLTTMRSEMRQWQSFLYHALARAQFFAIII